MSDLGKTLVILGVVLILVGAWVWSGRGFGPLGRMPGDIRIERENFRLHFPLVTCLILSAVMSFLFWIIRR